MKVFFTYESKENQCDCTVMNPPFSMKFKELSEKERENIQAEFQWKKSGVMDDIFILKGLKQAKRFGFFIIAVGVGTRSAEATFRKIIGNQLVELNRIEKGFDDTAIPVMFLVIEVEKFSNGGLSGSLLCMAGALKG